MFFVLLLKYNFNVFLFQEDSVQHPIFQACDVPNLDLGMVHIGGPTACCYRRSITGIKNTKSSRRST